jgi:hypothetical protein
MAKPDFSKTEVVKAYVYNIFAPAIRLKSYCKETIEGKKGSQLARMKGVLSFASAETLS